MDTSWTSRSIAAIERSSEFIRDVLRDAVKHPEFNRADWKAIAAGEVEVAAGRTHSSDEVKAQLRGQE